MLLHLGCARCSLHSSATWLAAGMFQIRLRTELHADGGLQWCTAEIDLLALCSVSVEAGSFFGEAFSDALTLRDTPWWITGGIHYRPSLDGGKLL